MSKRAAIWLTVVGVIIILGLFVTIKGVGYSNEEKQLRNKYSAQLDINKAIKDKTWKVVKQKAGILEKYAYDFKEAFNGIFGERYQGEAAGAPMFKWIKEHNPDYSVEMYKDLSDAIESNQAEFLECQIVLRSIKQSHDDILQLWPSSMFVGKREPFKAVIITSKKTKEVFETGEDNDIELFDEKE